MFFPCFIWTLGTGDEVNPESWIYLRVLDCYLCHIAFSYSRPTWGILCTKIRRIIESKTFLNENLHKTAQNRLIVPFDWHKFLSSECNARLILNKAALFVLKHSLRGNKSVALSFILVFLCFFVFLLYLCRAYGRQGVSSEASCP